MGLSRSLQNAPNLGARALFAATLALALGLAGSLGCGSSSGGGGYNLGAVTPTWTHAMALVAVDPAVAVSPQGNALVAWNEITSHSVVKAQWLAAGASSISLSDPTLDSGAPAVATDGTGAAQVLWLQMDQTGGGVGHVWGRRWSGGSWSAAVQLSTNSFAYASNPQVACDGAGNALALWAEGSAINSNHFDLFAARFSGGSWSVPIRLSNGTNSTYSPRIAMNATGQAIAVWTQTEDDGSISNGPQDTWAVTFSANGTPATPVQLNTVSGATALATAGAGVGINATGQGVAVWIQDDSGTGTSQVWACTYAPGSGWSLPTEVTVPVPGAGASAPDVALDSSGHAMAVWQWQEPSSATIAASQLTLGGTWSWTTPKVINSGINAFDPHVAYGSSGNATAVWYQVETSGCTVRSAVAIGNVWSTPSLVDSLAITYGSLYPVPTLASNPVGTSVIVWGVDSM